MCHTVSAAAENLWVTGRASTVRRGDRSLDLGIGEPDGCAKKAVGGCQVFRCPGIIEATPRQGTEPDVGAITITWTPASDPGGGGLPPRIVFGPESYDLFFWQTGAPVARFGFSAAGGTVPAFPAMDVDAPQPFAITEFNGNPAGSDDPRVPRGADLRVTWSGGTADAVFVLQQLQFGSGNVVTTDLRAVCRAAVSAGTFTFSSGVLGEFQPGDVSLRASAVSSKMAAAGDHATTLEIAAPFASGFVVKVE